MINTMNLILTDTEMRSEELVADALAAEDSAGTPWWN